MVFARVPELRFRLLYDAGEAGNLGTGERRGRLH